MKALVTKSANDIAVAIAERIAGSEDNFARLMTQRARQIGMRATTFRNASGCPTRDQVTTARDMLTLALRLQDDHPKLYPAVLAQVLHLSRRQSPQSQLAAVQLCRHRRHQDRLHARVRIQPRHLGQARRQARRRRRIRRRDGRHAQRAYAQYAVPCVRQGVAGQDAQARADAHCPAQAGPAAGAGGFESRAEARATARRSLRPQQLHPLRRNLRCKLAARSTYARGSSRWTQRLHRAGPGAGARGASGRDRDGEGASLDAATLRTRAPAQRRSSPRWRRSSITRPSRSRWLAPRNCARSHRAAGHTETIMTKSAAHRCDHPPAGNTRSADGRACRTFHRQLHRLLRLPASPAAVAVGRSPLRRLHRLLRRLHSRARLRCAWQSAIDARRPGRAPRRCAHAPRGPATPQHLGGPGLHGRRTTKSRSAHSPAPRRPRAA